MANTKISSFPAATSVLSTDILPVITDPGGTPTDKIVTVANLQSSLTGAGLVVFSGPASSAKTFTLPNASSTVLTSNAAVTVAQGGTGDTTLTAYAVLCGGTTSTAAVQSIASVGTSGQVLTSNGASALPTFQAAAGGGGLTWTEVTGTTQSMTTKNGYIANNAALVTITLPTTAALGDTVEVVGKGAGLWKIAQNASGIIHFGSIDTTTGVGGSLQATNRYDSISLRCIVANNEWVVLGSQGSITIV